MRSAEGCVKSSVWLLEVISYCAVDCYAIISGYVLYSDKRNVLMIKKYAKIWIPVFTYGFGVTFFAFLLKPKTIGINLLIKSCFPVATSQYWYVSAYTGMFFLFPYLNRLMQNLSREESKKLVVIIFGIFSVYSTFANLFSDTFKLNNGYSFIWITLLYLLGAYIRKYSIALKTKICIFLIFCCDVFSWLMQIISFYICGKECVLVSYISPTILGAAIANVILFSRLNLKLYIRKIIELFAPAAFGVYLIHTQGVIYASLLQNRFVWISDLNAWQAFVETLVIAFIIFGGCLLIEMFRIKIFKVLKIDELVGILCNKLYYNWKDKTNKGIY